MTVARLRRVVFVSTTLGPYGAENQVRALAERFRHRGLGVGIIAMVSPEGSTADLEARAIRVASLGMKRGVPDPRAILRLRRLLNSWRPDIVHSHMVHANLLTRLSRLVAPMPVLISTQHNANEGATWRYLAYRATDRLADVTTNVSRGAVAEATRRGAAPTGRIQYVPNGIDLSPFAPNPGARTRIRRELSLEGRFVWLALGRLAPAKDYGTMLEALSRTRAQHPEVVLLIAGTGPLRAELEATIGHLNLGASVRLLGMRNDAAVLLRGADGYVMSSAWEGLPMALLEASASGLPIVATEVGGNGEVVIHGASGFMVRSGNPAALSEAMNRIMELSPAERAAMGATGRRVVAERYALDRVVDTWQRIYESLLTTRRR